MYINKKTIHFYLKNKVLLGVCSIPEYIIIEGLCTGWPNSAFLPFLSVCISSYTIQAGSYWKLWAWADILSFKIKFDLSRCIFGNQINYTSLEQDLSPVLLINIVSFWWLWRCEYLKGHDRKIWQLQSWEILLIFSACDISYNLWRKLQRVT